jgi:hypothetical protein
VAVEDCCPPLPEETNVMPNRRLALRRETLSPLEHDELTAVVGGISAPHPVCVVLSVQYSQCYSCGIGCTYDCPATS